MSLIARKPLTATLTPLLLTLGAVPLLLIIYDSSQMGAFERRCTAAYEATQPLGVTEQTILFVFGKGAERLPKPTAAQMFVRDHDASTPGGRQPARLLTCTVAPDGTVVVRSLVGSGAGQDGR
ncbi:hypothetical protein [Deinococcus humi]|uniref:Uncharacterized protein n=1 Tax=Deinococcus humi TaxID=662880 RepID=A0A7W8K0L1_9DEIO|nr:hypothetical protein [Deinococcus humi]MBB5366430.1 hypothetical protein [Deinococcus humi]GGO41850.1 hypothetical protein GCM10008949_53170 [Deinococcus humi]